MNTIELIVKYIEDNLPECWDQLQRQLTTGGRMQLNFSKHAMFVYVHADGNATLCGFKVSSADPEFLKKLFAAVIYCEERGLPGRDCNGCKLEE